MLVCIINDYIINILPVTERSRPLALTPRIAQSNHSKLLAVKQVENSRPRQRYLAYSGDRVGVAFHKSKVRLLFLITRSLSLSINNIECYNTFSMMNRCHIFASCSQSRCTLKG